MTQDDIILIGKQVDRYAKERFTGKVDISLFMNQGGIGRISFSASGDLKKPEKKGEKEYRED